MVSNASSEAQGTDEAATIELNGLSNDVRELCVSSTAVKLAESRASPPNEVRGLLDALTTHCTSLQSKPLIRSSTFNVSSSSLTGRTYTLHSWKVLEHAYRKVTSVGVGPLQDMPTLARGLFTLSEQGEEERIVVRGYDKFFNVGELPWTKPKALAEHTIGPYTVTWKENGCIIFLSALDQGTLLVCSKHSTGQRDEGVLSHAQVGEVWLDRHLEKRGRTREELAGELWRRGETAVAELCDDNFEEHVLAYAPERSGLYFHGLNANSVEFRTRPINEVAAFANQWGFLPPRWREFNTLAELNDFTSQVALTGAWEGEALEGFVVRTAMPRREVAARQRGEERETPSPPYSVGQAWFFKVKFDYPYLMYREWRERTRKMLAEHVTWKAAQAEQEEEAKLTPLEAVSAPEDDASTLPPSKEVGEPTAAQPEEETSKSELKRRRKKQEMANRKAGLIPSQVNARSPIPELLNARSGPPETRLYLEWVHARLYGKASEQIEAQPELFAGFTEGRGIIALRHRFLAWLASEEGQRRLRNLGGASAAPGAVPMRPAAVDLPFTHTLIVPVAVPGCGKTSLSLALAHLFSAPATTYRVAHVQSDDVIAKRSGPLFLQNVEAALHTHDMVIADRNNHLLQHRAEVIARAEHFESNSSGGVGKGKTKGKAKAQGKVMSSEEEKAQVQQQSRVRLVVLAWQLDTQPLNKLHRLCAQRILQRGENHQSLRADVTRGVGTRTHEVALWRFLESMRAFGSSALGEGEGGAADERFDHVIELQVDAEEVDNLRSAASKLAEILQVPLPSEEALQRALDVARAYRVSVKKDAAPDADLNKFPRYYGLSVEFDSLAILQPLFANALHQQEMNEAARAFTMLRLGNRLIKGPHVTLVHSKELPSARQRETQVVQLGEAEVLQQEAASLAVGEALPSLEEEPTEAQLDAQRRWDHYASLSSESLSTAAQTKFTFTIDRIAWNARVMTLGISPSSLGALREIQPNAWTPHITLGMANDEVRPYEAARVLRVADALASGDREIDAANEQSGEVRSVRLPHGGIQCVGVLQGMYR